MSRWMRCVTACLTAMAVLAPATAADRRQTVCTITVNSPDEKQALARHLPASRFRFVELVQPGEQDWLRAACRSGTVCDVMVISGHYDGGNEFFSDGAEARESLRVSDLERASCSEGCAGLFSRLKEVYLFGCNTLNPMALSSATVDAVRSAVRERDGRSAPARDLALLGTVYGESSRERMRQVFNGVPAIYGFPSMAPLGPVAAAALERHLRAGGAAAFGRGRADLRLLQQFATAGLTVAQGVSEDEASARWDVCRFADERLPDAQVARHVHRLLRRDIAQVRMHLDRLQRITTLVTARAPRSPALALALQDLAEDFISRLRFLEAARAADESPARVRMLRLARDLGWLTPHEHRAELQRLLRELHARAEVGLGEVALACTLNAGGELDGAWRPARPAASAASASAASTLPDPDAADDRLGHAALRACLGQAEGRARTLAALVAADASGVQIAQAYLRQRPIVDAAELRAVVQQVAAMPAPEAQARALEALGRHEIGDAAIVDTLAQVYAATPTEAVQVAVAGLLVRVDRALLERARVLPVLVERRIGGGTTATKVDALIARLQAS